MTELVDAGLSGVYPGPASTPPTRIGALIACAATEIWSAASGLASGSMSDEFSGQMTNSGCGARPARTSSDSVHRLPHVVVEHGTPLGIELQPETRHVALDRGDVDGRFVGGTASRNAGPAARSRPCRSAPGRCTAPGSTTAGGAASAPGFGVPAASPPVRDLESQRRETESEQRHRERHQRRPAELRERQQRAVGLAETDYSPRESAERHRRLQPTRPAPTGPRTRPASPATCAPSTASSPNTPGNTACTADSASHGTGPTSPPIHGSSGM